MGNNEKNDCNYQISTIFLPGFWLVWRKVIVWCAVNLIFTKKAVNFHKIFNQTGVGGSDSAVCKNEIYQFLQMLPPQVPNSADTPTKLTRRPMLNLTTVTDQHSSQDTEFSRHTYQTTRTNRHELKDCWCELNNSSRSTFLPRYQIQPTHLPN